MNPTSICKKGSIETRLSHTQSPSTWWHWLSHSVTKRRVHSS